MKYTFLFFFLAYSLLLIACSQKSLSDELVEEKNGEFIHHVRPDQSKNINAESQLKNLSFIPLEGTSRSLLGGIEKLDQDSVTGYWYILGDKRKNAITVFEKDGKFVKRIKHIGNGPGEYQQINDFYLVDGKWVEILDGRRQKLLKYDLKIDTLVTEKKVPFTHGNIHT